MMKVMFFFTFLTHVLFCLLWCYFFLCIYFHFQHVCRLFTVIISFSLLHFNFINFLSHIQWYIYSTWRWSWLSPSSPLVVSISFDFVSASLFLLRMQNGTSSSICLRSWQLPPLLITISISWSLHVFSSFGLRVVIPSVRLLIPAARLLTVVTTSSFNVLIFVVLESSICTCSDHCPSIDTCLADLLILVLSNGTFWFTWMQYFEISQSCLMKSFFSIHG